MRLLFPFHQVPSELAACVADEQPDLIELQSGRLRRPVVIADPYVSLRGAPHLDLPSWLLRVDLVEERGRWVIKTPWSARGRTLEALSAAQLIGFEDHEIPGADDLLNVPPAALELHLHWRRWAQDWKDQQYASF